MQKIIKRRAYLSELVKWLDTPFIKVITGIRRSGKSTLLQNIKQEIQNRGINEMQIIYLNFESFATEFSSTYLNSKAETMRSGLSTNRIGKPNHLVLRQQTSSARSRLKIRLNGSKLFTLLRDLRAL